jgi:hypothetical protein
MVGLLSSAASSPVSLRCAENIGWLNDACWAVSPTQILRAEWTFADNSQLILIANLSNQDTTEENLPTSLPIYSTEEITVSESRGHLPSWSVAWFLQS